MNLFLFTLAKVSSALPAGTEYVLPKSGVCHTCHVIQLIYVLPLPLLRRYTVFSLRSS